jgi:hypothetical protein
MADAKQQTYSVRGWPLGLNSFSPTFKVQPNELAVLKNLRVEQGGYLVPRKGFSKYETTWPGGAVKGAYRHEETDGNKQVIAASGSAPATIYSDEGGGTFASRTTLTESADGYLRFAQWRDTIFCMSDAADIKVYHRGATPEIRTSDISHPDLNAIDSNAPISGGNLEELKTYTYRCTVDFELDGDFLSESVPLILSGVSFNQAEETTTATNKQIEIKKGADNLTSDTVQINIYRTEATDSGVISTSKDPAFWFLTSITTAVFNVASVGDVLFTDDGNTPLTFGRRTSNIPAQIFYGGFDKPPRCRFAATHKNRMWSARTTADPHYLYFSEYLEPERVRETSFLPIGYGGNREGGGPITVIASLMNRELVVAKANALWRVAGGDNETLPGVPDFEIEMITPAVGCIAPETMIVAEGALMWLSHRGVYVYDGTVPKEIRTHEIRNILEGFTAAQKNVACATYYPKRREYWLAIDTTVLIYSFITDAWSEHEYKDGGTAVVYNHLLMIQEGDAIPDILGCTDAATAADFHLMDSADSDNGANIDWTATTGALDFNHPDQVKKLAAIIVLLETTVTVSATFILDGGVSSSSLGSITTLAWQQRKAFKMELERMSHVAIQMTGSSAATGISIQGIEFKYIIEESILVGDD